MRKPPPLSDVAFYPVTGGICLLAIIATIAWKTDHSIARIRMNYLAFHGEPWRLITSLFPHDGPFHLLFNLYWIWALGSLIEKQFGHVRTALLYLILGVGSAAAEYAFNTGGVGLSGVGYGIFGFLWALSRFDARHSDAMDPQTTKLFIGWFFFCIVLTVTGVLRVANYAHGVGAILGALIGWSLFAPARQRAVGAGILVICLAAIGWSATGGRRWVNFSKDGGADLAALGLTALEENDNARALRMYLLATSMRHTHANWWHNLAVAYARLHEPAKSRAALKKAEELGDKPDTPPAG